VKPVCVDKLIKINVEIVLPLTYDYSYHNVVLSE